MKQVITSETSVTSTKSAIVGDLKTNFYNILFLK